MSRKRKQQTVLETAGDPVSSDYSFFPVKKTKWSFAAGPVDEQRDTSDHESPFPRNNYKHIWIIPAKRRQGKSSLLCKGVTFFYNKHFTKGYMVSATANFDDKYKQIIEYMDKRGDSFYDMAEDDYDGFADAIEECAKDMRRNMEKYRKDLSKWNREQKDDRFQPKRPKPQEPNHLLILDDVLHLLPHSVTKDHPLFKFTNNLQFYKCNLWLAAQTWGAISAVLKRQPDMITIFPSVNEGEYQTQRESLRIPNRTFDFVYSQAIQPQMDAANGYQSLLHIHTMSPGLVPRFFDGAFREIMVPVDDAIVRPIKQLPTKALQEWEQQHPGLREAAKQSLRQNQVTAKLLTMPSLRYKDDSGSESESESEDDEQYLHPVLPFRHRKNMENRKLTRELVDILQKPAMQQKLQEQKDIERRLVSIGSVKGKDRTLKKFFHSIPKVPVYY